MTFTKSGAWKYFSKLNKEEAICQVDNCNEIIKCKGGTTSAMRNHLKKHNIDITEIDKCNNTNTVKGGQSKRIKMDNTNIGISKFITRESLGEILAKCAAKDGFPFKSIVNSAAIKGYVRSHDYNMPKSSKTVRDLIMSFYYEKKRELQNELKQMITDGCKFSITVDEWTDILMKRYLNITLHSVKNTYYLGLIQIIGSCNYEIILNVIKRQLQEFNINFDTDIVASTHDGAAVMVKYGATIEAFSQLCFNHAIHLAIIDVLYKKKDFIDDEIDMFWESECENESDDENYNNNNFYNDGNINFEPELSSIIYIRTDVGKVLEEVRKIVIFFRKSALRSCVLQNHIINQGEKPLKLLLDCKTRWNSLIPMIRRFLKQIKSINMALNELGAEQFDEENLEILKEVFLVLEPMELAVMELSKNNSNLLIADGVFIHLFKKLKEINTNIAKEMSSSLNNRINERRQINLVSLLYFLQNGKYLNQYQINDSQIKYASKAAIKSLVNKIWDRLFIDTHTPKELESIVPANDEIQENLEGRETAYTEMQTTINSLITLPQERPFKDIQDDIKKIEVTGLRNERVQKLYNALMTIQPTSTASERTFSVAGNFKTKIRSQLNEETLNGLVFLKYYFLRTNK